MAAIAVTMGSRMVSRCHNPGLSVRDEQSGVISQLTKWALFISLGDLGTADAALHVFTAQCQKVQNAGASKCRAMHWQALQDIYIHYNADFASLDVHNARYLMKGLVRIQCSLTSAYKTVISVLNRSSSLNELFFLFGPLNHSNYVLHGADTRDKPHVIHFLYICCLKKLAKISKNMRPIE